MVFRRRADPRCPDNFSLAKDLLSEGYSHLRVIEADFGIAAIGEYRFTMQENSLAGTEIIKEDRSESTTGNVVILT